VDYPPGEFFYHYTTRSAAFEQILPTGKLRLSPYARVNDPLESKPWTLQGRWGIGPDLDLERPERAFRDFVQGAHVIWASAKLLALTIDAEKGYGGKARPFGRGWSRARMWDQYAEQHQGVCLLFRRRKLRRHVLQSLNAQGLAAAYNKPVRYTAGGPAERILQLDLGALAEDVTPAFVTRFVEDHNDDLFFLKTRDWETEHEYRFVVTASDGDYVFVEYADALEAVILGERFPPWQRAGALETCAKAGANIAQMTWAAGVPRPEALQDGATDGSPDPDV
jgi:hypothetical protein